MYPDADQSPALAAEEIEAMLLLIEQTRPEAIQPEHLVQLGPYSFAQLRLAIAQQALSCFKEEGILSRRAKKSLDDGKTASLIVLHSLLGVQEQTLPNQVTLKVNNGDSGVLNFSFPICEPSAGDPNVRFDDWRNPSCHTSLTRMQKGATQQQIQHMWSGLRWLCRNLRLWNKPPGITWPEEI